MIKTLLLTLALLAAFPAAAQVPFDQLPEQTTLDPTQQILVVDTTIADPLQQQRRMMLQRALDWVQANPTGATTDTLTTLAIGGTVFNFAGGGGTADGVLTGGSVTGDTATFTRSVGADIDVTGFFAPSNLIAGAGITITSGSGQNVTFSVPVVPAGTWTGLTDTASVIQNDQCVKGNSAGNALIFDPCAVALNTITIVAGTTLLGDASRLIFDGDGVTASLSGTSGHINVTIPHIAIREEGVEIADQPTLLNCIGPSFNCINIGNNEIQMVVQPLRMLENGIELTNNLFGINVLGYGVDVLSTDQAIADIRFGPEFQDEGTQLSESGATIVNHVGAGVTSSFDSTTGALTVNVPGGVGADGVVSTAHLSTTGARQLDLTLERTNGLSNLQTGINLPIALWAVEDNADVVGSAEPFRIGTGQRDGTRFLRDDGAWSVLPGGGGTADGVVDSLDFASGTRVLTASRTNGLADLTATVPGDGTGPVESLPEADVTYSNSGAQIDIDGPGTLDAVMGQIVAFQYRGAFTASNTGITITYNGHGANTLAIKDAVTRRQMTLNDFTRYDYMMAQKAAPDWIMVGGTQHLYRFAHTAIENNGTELIDNATAINFAAGVTATVSGETVTVTAAGTGGLSAVATESPVSGDGVAGTPVTIADGAMNLVHLSSGARYYRGDWTSLQTYVRGQSVEHDAHLWINAFGASAGDEPAETSTVWYRIDHRPTAIENNGTEIIDNASTLNFAAGVTATVVGETVTVTAAGTGGGDITSVTTPINSGMMGGETAGDVTLGLDVSNLTPYVSTISPADHVAVSDEGETGDPTRRLSLNQLAHWQSLQDNGGIAATNGQFHIQPNELFLSTTPANADRIVGWDQSAFVTRAFELDTLRSYFRTVAANPGGSPSDSLTTISIDGTDYSIEGGGGGSLTVTTDDIANVSFTERSTDVNFAATLVAVDTGISVPANTQTILANWGSSYDTAGSGIDLPWFSIPIDEWERLDGVDVGDRPTQGNARFTRTWRDTDIATGGGTAARQIWISKGNNGNVFVMADNVGYDIYPFRVRFEIHETVSVVTDVTGSGGGGGGSTTFVDLTDTPAAITADECVMGNAGGDALEFGACATGAGDITAVLTPVNSGLAGGADAGDADLLLDVSNLPIYNTTIDEFDHLVLSDESETNDPSRRLTLDQYSTFASARANGGIAAEDGQFYIRANELLTTNIIADADRLLGWDTSAGFSRTWELPVLRTYFRDGLATTFVDLTDTPAAITADECVMGNAGGDALEFGACGTGGGGGDITAVTTALTSGLSGGETSGDVALELDVSNLPVYSSTISGAEDLVLSDPGQPGNTTRRLTMAALATWQAGQANGGIAATNGRYRIQPNELLIATAVADADRLMGWDHSSFAPRSWEASTLRDYFGAGGGGGDITAVLTAADSGLEGGVTTGSADLSIADGAITNARIASEAVTRVKIGEAAIGTIQIANGAVATADLANDAVTITKIADDSVDTPQLRSGAVSTTNLANNAVTSAKIGNGQVMNADLANDSVTNAKIANFAISQQKISTSGVGSNNLQNGAVTTTKLAARAVTQDKISSSVHLDGNPTTSTQATSDDSNRIATTAFVQAATAGGGGAGDITAVTTAAGSGLAGGVLTGAADLSLSLNGMGSGGVLAAADEFPFDDKSDALGRTFLTSFANHAAWLAGGVNAGIGIGPGGEPNLDIADLANLVSLRVGDSLALSNTDDEDDDTQKMTIEAWTDLRAGVGISRNGTQFFFDADDLAEHGGAIDENMDYLVVINDSFSAPNRAQKIRMLDFYEGTLDAITFGFSSEGRVLIQDDGIRTEHLRANAVTSAKIANSAITQQKIAANAVRTTEIANNAVTGPKIAANAIGTSDIANGSIEPEDHADPDLLVNDVAYTSSPRTLTAVGWRDCRLLEFVFNDSNENLDHSAMVSALAIINSDTNGVRFAISNNETVTARPEDADGNGIIVLWNGATPGPAAGDTMTIRCF